MFPGRPGQYSQRNLLRQHQFQETGGAIDLEQQCSLSPTELSEVCYRYCSLTTKTNICRRLLKQFLVQGQIYQGYLLPLLL